MQNRTAIRHALFVFKLTLGFALLYWLMNSGHFDWNTFNRLWKSEHVWLLCAALAAQLMSSILFIARWWLLVKVQGLPVPLFDVLRTGFQGLFTILLVPGSIGLDGIRLLYLNRNFSGRVVAGAASLVMDRFTGFLGLVMLGLLSSLFYHFTVSPNELSILISINGFIALFLATAGIFCALAPRRFVAFLESFHVLSALLTAFRIYNRNKLIVAFSTILAICSHLSSALAWSCGLKVLGESAAFSGISAISSMLTIVRTLPITPMGLGVADGASELLFNLLGITDGAELQMLLRIVTMLILVASGLAFLVNEHGSRRST